MRIAGSPGFASLPALPRRALGLALLAALLLSASACHGPRHREHHARHHGWSAEPGPIQVVSALVGGKNVFIPSTIAVVAGEPVTLSIFNTTDIPHGFAIPALGIAEVLPAQQEYTIELPALEPRQLLRIGCQLHTAHRGATLVVLPAARREH